MKRLILTLILLNLINAKDWVELNSSEPINPLWNINQISDDLIEISYEMGGYF